MLTDSTFIGLNPLAHPEGFPYALQKSHRTLTCVTPVVLSHDGLYGFGRFVRVIKWDGANIMVKDMGFDDTMKQLTADETKLAINCRSSATSVSPGRG